jgi:Protein of unknown function (DUF3237)
MNPLDDYSRFLAPPQLEAICDLHVLIGPPIELGQTSIGLRRIIPITGGTVKGAINGSILPGGSDTQLLLNQGQEGHLDARYVIETNQGEKVFVQNKALRVMSIENSMKMMRGERVNPEEIYFRSQPQFETSSPKLQWLSEHQFIGCGVRLPDAVLLRFFKVI